MTKKAIIKRENERSTTELVKTNKKCVCVFKQRKQKQTRTELNLSCFFFTSKKRNRFYFYNLLYLLVRFKIGLWWNF